MPTTNRTRYGRATVIHCGDPVVVLPPTRQIPYTTLAVEADAWIAELRAQRDDVTVVRLRADAPCLGGDEVH